MELAYYETCDDFICNACNNKKSQVRKRTEEIIYPLCCGQPMEKVIDYSCQRIDMSPRTLGSLAEKNTKKMGTYEREQKRREFKAEKYGTPLED